MKKVKKFGFTLIELLVAISILAVLSTLVLANLNSARERGRDARRKNDLNQIKTALRLYYNDNQAYPVDSSNAIPDGAWGDLWDDEASGTIYMSEVPDDPLLSVYSYYYDQDGVDDDSFTLIACLENKNDDAGIDTGCHDACDDWCYIINAD